jgi:hypothetical protein
VPHFTFSHRFPQERFFSQLSNSSGGLCILLRTIPTPANLTLLHLHGISLAAYKASPSSQQKYQKIFNRY